jgi:uncharacterized membrane protein YcaP (DUF421 family)
LELIFSALTMIVAGFLAVRFAGRKTLSRMTISQAVIMIAVGSVLVEPVKSIIGESEFQTMVAIVVFISTLLILEFFTIRSKTIEQILIGKPVTVISNSVVDYKALRRLRMTESQLYMLLREKGVFEIGEVRTASIEANGEIAIRKQGSP